VGPDGQLVVDFSNVPGTPDTIEVNVDPNGNVTEKFVPGSVQGVAVTAAGGMIIATDPASSVAVYAITQTHDASMVQQMIGSLTGKTYIYSAANWDALPEEARMAAYLDPRSTGANLKSVFNGEGGGGITFYNSVDGTSTILVRDIPRSFGAFEVTVAHELAHAYIDQVFGPQMGANLKSEPVTLEFVNGDRKTVTFSFDVNELIAYVTQYNYAKASGFLEDSAIIGPNGPGTFQDFARYYQSNMPYVNGIIAAGILKNSLKQ
jgi:hypothetical protein